jgi:protein-S-isoprenylcysteine O-methyltransferase Ste14
LTRDFFARLSVALLFVFLSINLLTDFLHTRHLTGLLLLASESLVVVLTVFRRPTAIVDRSALARLAALVSIVGPPLFRVGGGGALAPDAVTASVSAAGLVLVIAGKATLGRSFGIVAANRGVVASGPYLLMRHPIYVGYLLSYVAFCVANPTVMNLAIMLMTNAALVWRALIEERTLVNDERYRTYCNRVAWHFVPGVF